MQNAFYCSKPAIFINIAPHLNLSYLTEKFSKYGRAQRGKKLMQNAFPYWKTAIFLKIVPLAPPILFIPSFQIDQSSILKAGNDFML